MLSLFRMQCVSNLAPVLVPIVDLSFNKKGIVMSLCFAVFAGKLREEVRTKYNLPSDPCADCCVHLCCSPLAVCQEAREIKVSNTSEVYLPHYREKPD